MKLEAINDKLQKVIGELINESQLLRKTNKPTINYDTTMATTLGTVNLVLVVHTKECAPLEDGTQIFN